MDQSPTRRVRALTRHLTPQSVGGGTQADDTTLLSQATAAATNSSNNSVGGLSFEDDGKIAILTLVTPFMDAHALRFFESKVEEVKRLKDVRCLVIRGQGRSFCAGANFKSGSGAQIGADGIPKPERSFNIYKPFLSLLEVEVGAMGVVSVEWWVEFCIALEESFAELVACRAVEGASNCGHEWSCDRWWSWLGNCV